MPASKIPSSSRLIPGFLLAALGISACAGRGADHETLGDRAYLARDFAGALVEYQLEQVQNGPDPELRSKTGLSALKAGDLLAAVREYRALALQHSDWTTYAAHGLERVARAASERGDRAALAVAIGALSDVAPELAQARFALEMARQIDLDFDTAAALAVLPAAAALAPTAIVQDSLVFDYARVLIRQRDCRSATPILESLVRRRRAPELEDDSRTLLSRCAWRVGTQELQDGRPRSAEEWFTRAVVGGREGDFVRAAYIGLGDVRFAQGDFVGAAEAYQEAILGAVEDDSLAVEAARKLNELADAGTVVPQ